MFCNSTTFYSRVAPVKRSVYGSGDEGARTPDPRLAKAVLSQLSYIPGPVSRLEVWA